MHLRFAWLPLPALAAALGAVVVTVALGLIGTFTALGPETGPGIEKSLDFAAFRRAAPPDTAGFSPIMPAPDR